MIVPQVSGVLIYIVSTYQKIGKKSTHPIKIIPGGRLIIIQFPSLEASAAREEAAAELWMVREEEQVAVKEAADAVPWTDFGSAGGELRIGGGSLEQRVEPRRFRFPK